MSYDADQHDTVPEFGDDGDANNQNDDSMFVSVSVPITTDVSLSGDEDDENPFGEPNERKKTPTNTTNTVESSVHDEKPKSEHIKTPKNIDEDEKSPFEDDNTNNHAVPSVNTYQEPSVVPEKQPSTPVKSEPLIFAAASSTPSTSSSVPFRPTAPFESQISSPSKSAVSEPVVESKPKKIQSKEYNIEITVSDPTKVGDGMSSYLTYRITTKTTLQIFTKSEFSVNRRFSDFLGLHSRLVNKHLSKGLFIPSPPEKDTLSMAKVKISKEDDLPSDFIDRRRGLLERYLNRLVRIETLLEDPDVREFIEAPHDLPKATNTQALSGAGVLRALSTISNQVTKLAAKTSEQDQWFEEKHHFIVEIHTILKRLYTHLNTLFSQRKEAGQALRLFSVSLNHLATAEEHASLSHALTELSSLQEKLDQTYNEQSMKEYSILAELVKEYIGLLEMVQLAFQERIKVHQQWLNAEETLRKKRDTKTKLEQSPKGADKLPQAEMEIRDWEGKVVHCKEDFERISAAIRREMEMFDETRFEDFRKASNDYLNDLLEEQNKVLQLWEAYLPEANKINL